MMQEVLALTLCAVVGVVSALKLTHFAWSGPLARFLVRRGRVRWARRVLGLRV